MTENNNKLPQEEEYTSRFSLDVWARIFAMARPNARALWTVAIIAVVLAGIEGFMICYGRMLIDAIGENGRDFPVMKFIYIHLVATTIACTLVWAFIIAAGRVCTAVSHDIRKAAFEHLQKLSFAFYDHRPAGWLVARLTGDCDRLSRTIAWGSLHICWGVAMLIASAVVLTVWNLKLALITFSVMPVLVWFALVFQKKIIRASRAVRKINSTITASFNEAIMGIKTTKTLVREAENLREFEEKSANMYVQSVHNAVLTAGLFPVVMCLGSLAASLAMWFGGNRVMLPETAAGHISIGELAQFVNVAIIMIFPVLEISRIMADAQTAQASAERIFSLLDTEPEVKDSDEVAKAIEQTSANGNVLPDDKNLAIDGHSHEIGQIEFRNVSFAYEKDKKVLKNFSLTVSPGQSIAFVGPTGGGKTTVVSLLCRFYQPTEGEILIDGVDYRNRSLDWLQSNLGIVLQHPHLFSGTIADNIRYGRLDATDDEVMAAAKAVKADSFFDDMSDGINSEVGQSGNRLSTGQKQLVSFARAVLADPQIFVMDEATSSVDTETEKLIQDGLATVLEGRISFIIAHRLSTIRSADRIIFIEDGEMVEDGDHKSLLAQKGKYWRLYTNQFANEQTEHLLADDHESDSE